MDLLKAALEKLRSDGIYRLVVDGSPYLALVAKRKAVEPILFRLHRCGLLSLDELYPEDYYSRMGRPEARADAEALAELLVRRYDPESVIDLGCGVGRFLAPFHERDIDIHGVDAVTHAIEHAVIPSRSIEQHDLTEPYHPDDEYDLALCIEVLEHLPESAADTAIASISRCAPVAVVTTAPPGQGWTYHVNEQPLGYWTEKFEAVGMLFDDRATDELTEAVEADELGWLNRNLAVFVHRSR